MENRIAKYLKIQTDLEKPEGVLDDSVDEHAKGNTAWFIRGPGGEEIEAKSVILVADNITVNGKPVLNEKGQDGVLFVVAGWGIAHRLDYCLTRITDMVAQALFFLVNRGR